MSSRQLGRSLLVVALSSDWPAMALADAPFFARLYLVSNPILDSSSFNRSS